MSTKEQKVQTAFILAVIGSSVVDTLLLCSLFYYQIGFVFFSNLFATLLVMPVFAAPAILGGIALSIIKSVGAMRDFNGKYRVFYILTRILSIVTIVEGAIIGTIGLITGTVTLVNSFSIYTLL